MRSISTVAVGILATGSVSLGGTYTLPTLSGVLDKTDLRGGYLGAWGGGASSLNNFQPLVSPTQNVIRLDGQPVNTSEPFDIRFGVSSTGGATYVNVTSVYRNASPVPYPDFVLQLGTGLGADFVPFGDNGFVSFESPLAPPSATHFSGARVSKDTIVFTNGGLPALTPLASVFNIVVRDPTAGQTTFTLRQYAVPEPAMAGLLACGVAVLGRRRRV